VDALGWFYTTEDGYAGPVGIEELRNLLSNGRVTQNTLVWNETFGESWRPIRDTEIAQRKSPPPIPPSVRTDALVGQNANSPKKRPRPLIRGIVMAAATLFVFWLFGGGILLLHLFGYDTETLLSNGIPKCNSSTATDLAKQALENAPLSTVVKVSVYQIQDAQEVSYDGGTEKRTCHATALLNSGKREVKYTIEWADKAEKKIWLEVAPSE
jgi:GYF domain 2